MTIDQWIQLGIFFVLAGTGGVIWLYTRAAQRSNDIQEEPLINLYFKDTTRAGSSSDGEVSIKNIGKGPAYSITIARFSITGYSYRFYLESPLLESGQSAPLKMFIRTPGGGMEMSNMMTFLNRLIPQTLRPETIEQARNNPAIFLIHYKGVNRKTYHTAFALYSTLPPAGDVVPQFIIRGEGKMLLNQAKQIWSTSERIKSPVED